MIEIQLKNKEIIRAESIDEITINELDINVIQFLDYTDSDISWAVEKFGLDFSIMKHYEDIEISSHFSENENQASFHFSIPYYNTARQLIEEPMFLLFSTSGLFIFSSSGIDNFLNETYSNRFINMHEFPDLTSIFKSQIEFISDYYADITENLARNVKALASAILIEKEFSSKEMDIITRYNFNNLLIKESLIETTRVFNLFKKSNWGGKMDIKEFIETEQNDLMAVSDYIQFNFDRLDDLKENVSNKIDLEQNHIFKVLTVVTVCISLPTLVAGIYGMNFEKMPELNIAYGYPIVLIAMMLSAVLPFVYFKKKKWL